MTHFLRPRFVAGAMTTAAALAMFAAGTRADAISFFAQGSQQMPSLDVGGVTITGSSFLDFDPSHGLAIRGGLPGIGIGGPITRSIPLNRSHSGLMADRLPVSRCPCFTPELSETLPPLPRANP